LILVSIVYSNSFESSWHFDDKHNIITNENLHISELSWTNIFNSFYRIQDGRKIIDRPVARLTLALNWYVGKASVFGYHVVNFLIHVVNGFLLYFTILLIFTAPTIKRYGENTAYFVAVLTACWWAVHPIQVQAVTYIIQRMASLAALFYMTGIFFYLKGRFAKERKFQWLFFILSFFAYILAVGSKQNAIVLPFSFLLIEFVFFDLRMEIFKRKLFFLFFILFLVLFALLLSNNEFQFLNDLYKERNFTLAQRLLTEPRVLLFYLFQIFYPIESRFSLEHEVQLSSGLLSPVTTLFAILMIFLLVVTAVLLRRKIPFVSFAILFYFMNHFVESTILPLEIIFEHRNYLPSMFIFLPVSLWLYKLIDYYREHNKFLFGIIFCFISGLIVFIGLGAYSRNITWKTDESLWLDAMEKAPGNSRPYQNYSIALLAYPDRDEKLDKILELNRISLEKKPSGTEKRKQISAYNNIAATLSFQKKYTEAIENYKKVLDLNPNYNKPRFYLTQTYMTIGENKKALKTISKITTIQSQYLNLYALALIKNGLADQAIKTIDKIRETEPDGFLTLVNLSAAYKLKKDYKKSKHYLKQVLIRYPKQILGYFHMIDTCLLLEDINCQEKYGKLLLDMWPINQIFLSLKNMEEEKLDPEISLDNIVLLIQKIIPEYFAEFQNELSER